ncbi:leucyl aminopeptidase [Clostridium sp.]|uniref:leucyl aminopeptidase n=1 Tax=Clostridium sp. TaxID=1506 RepID=UPI002FCA117F
MVIKVVKFNEYKEAAEVKAIFMFESKEDFHMKFEDETINDAISFVIESKEFTGKKGELYTANLLRKQAPSKVILIGEGKGEELTLETIRKNTGKLIKECIKLKASSLEINMPALRRYFDMEGAVKAISEAIIMATYAFDSYKSDKKPVDLNTVTLLCCSQCDVNGLEEAIKEGIALGEGNLIARKLVNEPANVLTPAQLAVRAEKIGEDYGFEVKVYGKEEITKLGMEAYVAVAKGSANEPKLIVMKYTGDSENQEEVFGLVGKGLTFDTGGYCIKPALGMVDMKTDMGGAGAVIGAMSIIAKMKLRKNVVAVVAACENMISGEAYRPGDIIGSMAGKTIEVLNTDAEGRLTLADAVTYIIRNEKATRVVDIATLTGAVVTALGNVTTGVLTNHDKFYADLEEASKEVGEKVWRLPTFDEYKEQIKGDMADLKNIGGPRAGSITAGLFIGEFVEGKPWLHLDIAGTSASEKPVTEYHSSGATGVGARLLYTLVKKS